MSLDLIAVLVVAIVAAGVTTSITVWFVTRAISGLATAKQQYAVPVLGEGEAERATAFYASLVEQASKMRDASADSAAMPNMQTHVALLVAASLQHGCDMAGAGLTALQDGLLAARRMQAKRSVPLDNDQELVNWLVAAIKIQDDYLKRLTRELHEWCSQYAYSGVTVPEAGE